VNEIAEKDYLTLAARTARRHVARAAGARGGRPYGCRQPPSDEVDPAATALGGTAEPLLDMLLLAESTLATTFFLVKCLPVHHFISLHVYMQWLFGSVSSRIAREEEHCLDIVLLVSAQY
jgi:hypothetical protein